MKQFLLPLFLLLGSSAVRAEDRVALLIGDRDHGPVAAELAKFGFRCERSKNLPDKDLRRLIENWSARTPTNSTALLHFTGAARQENYNGRPAMSLEAANKRPVAIRLALERMNSRGGSILNLVLVDCPTIPPFDEDLPGQCVVGFGALQSLEADREFLSQVPRIHSNILKGTAIEGLASAAIAPPDRFVPGKQAGDEWVNARGMIFCWCPPGKYTAGSPSDTPGRFPDEAEHQVVIERGFWIGKYEVTRSQSTRNLSQKSVGTHKNHPIEMLHWDDGRPMASRTLTQEERKAGRLPASWQYDLPTEEQWEYAARAGTTTRWYFGEDLATLRKHANFADQCLYDSGDIFSNHAHRTLNDGFLRLAPVGSFAPNPWGLHDVYGNVAEWCRDKGARGGGWASVAQNCRSAYRDSYSSRNEQNYLGYRFVIQPNAPETGAKKR